MIHQIGSDAFVVSLLHGIGEGVIIVDLQGAPIRWNPAAERMMGLGEFSEGKGWLNRPTISSSEGRPLAGHERPLGRALLGVEVDEQEILLQRPGGVALLLSVTARPLRDAVGAVVGAVAVFREITEHRRHALALAESERLYRTLARHLPNTTVFLFDRDLRFLLAEGAGLAAAGTDSKQVEGRHVREHASPHLLAQYEAALAGKYSEGATEREGHFFKMQFVPVRDDEGAITGGLALAQDVTEERRAAAELASAEEQLRVFVEHAPIGMALVGLDGKWLRVNRALCDIVGYSRDELLAMNWRQLTHADDQELDRDRLGQLIRAEIPRYQLAKRYLRKDGRLAHVLLHASAIRDDHGIATALIVQVEDLTERRRLEDRLLLSDRLASVGTLAMGIAHEINNPLAYVMSNLEMIAEEIRDLAGGSPSGRLKELAEMTSEARDGAERVRKILRGLKTFSRSDEERRVPVEIHRVLEISINMAFNEIRRRAGLVRDFGKVPTVEADEARLAQVFINLLVNAAQALPEGQTEKNEIRVVTRTDPEGRAVIEVKDTGAGISPENLTRIFDPFFTTKAVGVGAGLGLAICHGIVTALDGELVVESELGVGTTFRVVLRALSAPVPEPKIVVGNVDTHARLRGRVLVVDDEPALASVNRRILREHEVVAVESGTKALALLLTGESFDIILCDLMMPVMTGMELHAELSRVRPDLLDRMVFVTGGAFTPAARAFLDSVPNPRFEKPIDVQNLRTLVDDFVARSSRVDSAERAAGDVAFPLRVHQHSAVVRRRKPQGWRMQVADGCAYLEGALLATSPQGARSRPSRRCHGICILDEPNVLIKIRSPNMMTPCSPRNAPITALCARLRPTRRPRGWSGLAARFSRSTARRR